MRPARGVPITRWRAEGSQWRARPATYAILALGLWLFGTGEALLVAAGLGVAPWTVLAQGLSVHLGLDIGLAVFLTSCLVLLVWIPLRQAPGLGTLANAILLAGALEVMLHVVPAPTAFPWQLTEALAGIIVIGIGSGLYLTTNLGAGPRDGMMTGLHRHTGWPVTPIRLVIEIVVLAIGWLLGGTVGLGTLLFALLVGPAVGYGLAIVGRLWHAPGYAVPDDPEAGQREHPELDA